MVRALDTGFILPFFRILSLPGASDLLVNASDGSDTCGARIIGDVVVTLPAVVIGNAPGINGIMDVLPTTDWHSSANKLLVSCLIWKVSNSLSVGGSGGGGGGGGAANVTIVLDNDALGAGATTGCDIIGTVDIVCSGTYGAVKADMVDLLSNKGAVVT